MASLGNQSVIIISSDEESEDGEVFEEDEVTVIVHHDALDINMKELLPEQDFRIGFQLTKVVSLRLILFFSFP